jgi:hypothetical protein
MPFGDLRNIRPPDYPSSREPRLSTVSLVVVSPPHKTTQLTAAIVQERLKPATPQLGHCVGPSQMTTNLLLNRIKRLGWEYEGYTAHHLGNIVKHLRHIWHRS